MKLSEVLCLVLPFIIVILVLSIDNKEKIEHFTGIEIPKVKKDELPEEPNELEEKKYDFIPSLICAFTPIAGDYGCIQRDSLLYESELGKYEKKVEEIKLENKKRSKELDKEIEKAKLEVCKKMGCKNGSECKTEVDDGDLDNKGVIIVSASCNCTDGWFGKDCSTKLKICSAEENCNGGKGVPNNKYDVPDIGCNCECEDGYGGGDCSEEYEQCSAAKHCNSHGESKGYDEGDGCKCECQEGWEGDDCSIRKNVCTAEDCSNSGTPKEGSYRPNPETGRIKGCECVCDGSHEGEKCEKLKQIEWSKSECIQDETCDDLRSNGTSRCKDNYYQTINSEQIPTCNGCPAGSQNVNPSSSKGGKKINNRLGSSKMSDCICDGDNEYLDQLTESCELCPENTIKSRNNKGDNSDCTCDISLGWYDNPNWKPNSDDQERCIRCGWDETEGKLKQGFTYEVTEKDGLKEGKCKCAPSYEQSGETSDEIKCFPTGKCSTSDFTTEKTFEGSFISTLNDYKKSLFDSAAKFGEPQNICSGIGARNQLAAKISESPEKDIRLEYDEEGGVIKDDNGIPLFSEIGNKFVNKIDCNTVNGKCSCPGSANMYLSDRSNKGEILPCQSCKPTRNKPNYLTYDDNGDKFTCSTSECFNSKDKNTLKGLGCLNYISKKDSEKSKKDNPLEDSSGPLIFKDDNGGWMYYSETGVKTSISDKIVNLCNSQTSPPKCGSKEGGEDVCSTELNSNWVETEDEEGNIRCSCSIPYEDRKEIDGKKTCIFDTSSCDLYSQEPQCDINNIYKCPAWSEQNDKWKSADFRLWGMATINHIGEPVNGDVQINDEGKIKEKECKGCYIPPPINPEGQETGGEKEDLLEVKNSSLFAGLPKKLSLSYMNDKGQWVHYCKHKSGKVINGYASDQRSFDALNPFTIMNDSSKPLPEGRKSANLAMGGTEGVCGKAQYYDIDQKKCFNIGGGCYSRGPESGWFTKDIGDFYNLGLPACNFKSSVSVEDVDTHDNRLKAGIAKKEKITDDPDDEGNLCCQSCHYKFYSPNSNKLVVGQEPKTSIYDMSKAGDLESYKFPHKYYGPIKTTPPTNHIPCVGSGVGSANHAWRGGRPFCTPGQSKGMAVPKNINKMKPVMDSTEDDHPVPTQDFKNTGPWDPSFSWTVHGVSVNCGGSNGDATDSTGKGNCGKRNDSFKVGNRTYTPRRKTISDYLNKSEGGGSAGMTGHGDVSPRNSPTSDSTSGKWGKKHINYGAHGYSGDSGFGLSTEDLYKNGYSSWGGARVDNSAASGGLQNKVQSLTNGPWDNTARGRGRRNVIGWNNQSKYTPYGGGADSVKDNLDPQSGKRDHWLGENGATLPITGVKKNIDGQSVTFKKTPDSLNHDNCSFAGTGLGSVDCSKTTRYPFDHHSPENKEAKGIGYPGIKVPSSESTKSIYGDSYTGPFSNTDINHATGFNSLPTDYYLHNHPKEGDGPYDENGNRQNVPPATHNFSDYGDSEFDVENKTHEQGKRYENLFYCKRSLGTPREETGKDYKNMISGASIDRMNYMNGKYAKADKSNHTYQQQGHPGEWGNTYHLVDDIVDGGKHPHNQPHLYTKNLIGLGKYSWALQDDKLLESHKSIKDGNSFLGGSIFSASVGSKASTTTGYNKDTSHIPKVQIQHLVNAGEPTEAVRAIVPRELNNMAYYDVEYGGWIQKNQTYQGTYLAKKWTRPWHGHNSSNGGTFWDRGGHTGARGPNDTHVLSMSGCRQWSWAGGASRNWANTIGGSWTGRPGWRTGGGHYGETSNPEKEGAGGDAWHHRSAKLNGKYTSCMYVPGNTKYMQINQHSAKVI